MRRVERNLFELFRDQALARPEAVAIDSAAGITSYAGLLDRAETIRRLLEDRGPDAEQAIGVLMQRGPDLVATLLAILGCGAAYVPLDLDDPPARIGQVIGSADCRIVLGDRRSIDRLLGGLAGQVDLARGRTFIDIESAASLPSSGPAGPADRNAGSRPIAPGGSRLAYILHTSGSTGTPKGVEIAHRSVVNLLDAVADLIGFGPDDCFLAASTVGFDISVAEIFLPLLTGARLLLRDRTVWLAPARLARDIVQHGVSVVQTGPSTWATVLAECPDFPAVRVAISTAEAISPALAGQLAHRATQAWNLYGPTEATVWATGHRLRADASGDAGRAALQGSASAPIGCPIAGTTVRILDPQGEPLGAGAVGELCLGGIGLARGYRHDDAMTAARFIVHGPARERLYRTGDLACLSADGLLQYHGRIDDQLKIRGVRIEPGDVESALMAHPQLRQAAVTWFENALGSRSLVAAIAGASPPTAEALHAWLGSRLPTQMIPSRFVFCEALPQTSAGKVDRRVIRERAGAPGGSGVCASSSDPGPAATPVRPQTATEAALRRLWQQILKVSDVQPSDHFFSIGGDSLSAVRLIGAVESSFGISLPIQSVFEAPILRRLAARIEQTKAREAAGGGSGAVFPLEDVPSGFPLFLVGADRRLVQPGVWQVPCSLYAVTDPDGEIGSGRPHSTAERALARIAGIRGLQPSGPYRIGGIAAGAGVAVEIAHLLERAGQEVELLFLLDPVWPEGAQRGIDRADGSEPRHAVGTPVAGRALALLTDPADIDRWQRLLGQDAALGLVDLAGEDPLATRALEQWLPRLERAVDAVNWLD